MKWSQLAKKEVDDLLSCLIVFKEWANRSKLFFFQNPGYVKHSFNLGLTPNISILD